MLGMQVPEGEPRLPHEGGRYDNPDTIEEDQIDPQKQEVAGVQVRATGEPFWTERHPACGVRVSTLND